MKVLTLNTWNKSGPWQKRWQIIVEGIARYQPDVIAFQELFDTGWRDAVVERSGYAFSAVPPPTHSGLVLLSRAPISASELYTLSIRSPFEDYNRYVLWTEIVWRGRPVHVFNTHLSWHPQDQATRMAQAREVRQRISREDGIDKLLIGDMNAPPDSGEIQWLLENAGLVDTFAAKNPPAAGTTWDTRNPFTSEQKPATPDRRIDYVFAGGDNLVKALSGCRVVFDRPNGTGIFASDHYGVLAEFDW